MRLSELVTVILLLGWLGGVGLLAHAVSFWLEDDDMPDFIRLGVSLFPERVAVLLAIVIVAWPLAIPGLIVIKTAQEKKKKS